MKRLTQKTLATLTVGAFALLAVDAHAADGTFKFSTGFDYSSGDYGASSDTDILYIPFTFKYQTLPWTVKLTVPYLRITGPGGVVQSPEGPIVVGSAGASRTTESGLGDIVASASYELNPQPLVEVTGKVKLGTADEGKGLGTGENDYAAQVDIADTYGKLTPFGTLGYRVTGDPAGSDLDNVYYASVGVGYKVDSLTSVGAIFDYKQAASRTSEDARELVGYVTRKTENPWYWTGYAVLGLSDGSPDAGLGLQWTYKK